MDLTYDVHRWNGRDGYFQPYGRATLNSLASVVASCHREFPCSAIKVREWGSRNCIVLDDEGMFGLIGLLVRTHLHPSTQDHAEIPA